MSILSGRDILKEIRGGFLGVAPFDQNQLQPASYDVRLSDAFRVFRLSGHVCIDTREIPEDLTTLHKVGPGQPFIIHPGQFVLGQTEEYWRFPANIVGRLEGKSSLGRIGLLIHATAGFFDPGFEGTGTLELSNVAGLPIKLYPGMLVGQMSFHYLSRAPQRIYGDPSLKSRYQGQDEPTASRYTTP